MYIREKIRKLLNFKKWSVYKLSKESGLAQSTLSDILTGKNKNPNLETLTKIADALDVSIDRLTGESISCLIEDRLEELDMKLEELAKQAGVTLSYINQLENRIPTQNDYDLIIRIAKVLKVHPGPLRAALARQEPPTYDGSIQSVEEDFFEDGANSDSEEPEGKKNKTIKIKPIIDSLDRAGDLQDEDINEIAQQVEFLINLKRKKKEDS